MSNYNINVNCVSPGGIKSFKTQNKKFKVIDVQGFLPQIIGKETDFIPVNVYEEKTE